jgi:hypothetical protein
MTTSRHGQSPDRQAGPAPKAAEEASAEGSGMSLAQDARPHGTRPSRRTLLTAGGVTVGGAMALTMARQAPAQAAVNYVVQGAQVVSVNDAAYGATGNGTTDDTAAIQAALNATPPGGICLFPAPAVSYLISSTLIVPSGISVLGPAVAPPGKYGSGPTPTPPVITIAAKTPSGGAVSLHAVISDAQFTSSGTPTRSSAILIRGLVIDGGAANATPPSGVAHGFALLTSASSLVDCGVQNTVGDGILITDTSALGTATSATSLVENGVYECRVYKAGGNGIYIQATTNVNTDGYLYDCIVDNAFTGSASNWGIQVDNCAGWRVKFNHVYAQQGSAYNLLNCDAAWIEDNYADNFGQASAAGTTYYGYSIQVQPYGRTAIKSNHTQVKEAGQSGSGAGNFIHHYVTANKTSQVNEVTFEGNSVRQISAGTGTSTGYSFNAQTGGTLTMHGVDGPFTVAGTPGSPSPTTSPYPVLGSGTVNFPGYRGTTTAYTPTNPASTTSTTLVMAGLALSYTPAVSGILRVQLVGGGRTATAVAGITVGLRYGTGTAPANGAAASGTGFGDEQFFGAPSTTVNGQFALNGIITGLTPGTAVWVDVAFDTASSSDAASLVNLSAIIEEVS